MFKKLRQCKCDGGFILFLIVVAIFGKSVHAVDKATEHGTKPVVLEKVVHAAGPFQSANHDRYND